MSAPPARGAETVDIGVNLTAPAFAADLPQVIGRAAAAGVTTMVITGTSVEGSRLAAELAERSPVPPPSPDAPSPAPGPAARLFATAGVHPHHAKDVDAAGAWLGELRALAARQRVVAIGECGLDFNRNFSPRREQLHCFDAQLALAVELGLPVFLHERDAHDDLLAVLANHAGRLPRAVVHCFTGTGAQLDAYLERGLHIGMTGWICDERRGRHLLDVVARIPRDRLMLETDAPYIVPRTMPAPPKNRRNEPAFLPFVLEAVARARGEDPAETTRATTETARAFFGLG